MSEAPDVTKLSNEQLMALIQSGQPVQPTNARTGQPLNHEQSQTYAQLAAAGGIDPRAEGGSPRLPLAQMSPQDTPPPGRFYIDPQGHVRQQPDAGRETAKAVSNGFVSAASGIPVLGAFADEADAATAAGLAPMLEPMLRHAPHLVQAIAGYDPRAEIGNIPTFKGRYDAAKNIQRFNADQFHDEHPVIDTGLKVAGGIGGTIAALPVLGAATAAAGPEAGLLVRSGAGAAEGGLIGATDAYGRGEGGATDPSRIHGAEMGAALGAAGGAALPVVSRVGGLAWRNTGGRLVDAMRGQRVVQAPMDEEAARIAKVLTEADPQASAMKPDRGDLESALVAAQRSPLKTRASNVDDAYVRIARAAARQKMTPAEMTQSAKEVGPFGTLADTGESARDLLRAAVNRPGQGATIAEENLTPRQNGIFDPATGTYPVRPSSQRITDQAQAGMGLEGKDFHSETDNLLAARKAAAGPAYDKAYSASPVDIGELRDFAGTPMFKDAYGRARAISQKEFVKLPDGTEQIQPLPANFTSNDGLDWRTLDLMKQGMQDTISEAKRQGIGANDQGATKGFLTRFVAKLDSLNPDYKAAREAFAGPTAMKDALEEGRTLLSEDAPVVAANIASRPESERQMLRLGALQALQTKLGNANVTFDAANQAGLLKPNQLARFKALFPDAKSFADFYRSMQSEKTMFGTNKAAFGNSTTAKQMLNVMEPSDPQVEGVTKAVAAGGTGNIISLVRAIHQMGMESPMNEDTAATIASVLSSHNAEQLPQIVRKMTDAQRSAAIADVIRKSSGTAAGAGASRAVQGSQ